MTQRQKQIKDFNGMLKDAFSDYLNLGDNYSLADGLFYDDNYSYPEKILDVGFPVDLISYDDVLNEAERELMKWQVENKTVKNKLVSWSEVTVEDMERFPDAFPFLSNYSFIHYFAAFMQIYVDLLEKGDEDRLDGAWCSINYFLDKYPDNGHRDVELDKEKINVVGCFLYLFSTSKSDEAYDAAETFYNNWASRSPKYWKMLEQHECYQELKDYIDKIV